MPSDSASVSTMNRARLVFVNGLSSSTSQRNQSGQGKLRRREARRQTTDTKAIAARIRRAVLDEVLMGEQIGWRIQRLVDAATHDANGEKCNSDGQKQAATTSDHAPTGRRKRPTETAGQNLNREAMVSNRNGSAPRGQGGMKP